MIGIVGLNHVTAPVQVREQLTFTEEEIVELTHAVRLAEARAEAVVISTCNRTELYFNLDRTIKKQDLESMRNLICIQKGCDPAAMGDYFYSHHGEEAVGHLFRVVAGLDSMVLGENEILGQAKDAYGISASRELTSSTLNRLFHRAFTVGKRVRTETGINEGASSASYAAVELASRFFEDLAEHSVTLIGTGETGVLVLDSLVKRGCTRIRVANRTEERAQSVGARFNAEVANFDDIESILEDSDIVVTSTASVRPIVDASLLSPVMPRRSNRPLFFVDIAVPRNVDDDVKKIDEVFLYDIDDLEEVVARNRTIRAAEVESAEAIVAEEAAKFFEWLGGLSLTPTIRTLKDSIGQIGKDELRRLSHRLSEQEYVHVDRYAKFLQKKYLGSLVKRLRHLTQNGQSLEYLDLVQNLFGLEPEEK